MDYSDFINQYKVKEPEEKKPEVAGVDYGDFINQYREKKSLSIPKEVLENQPTDEDLKLTTLEKIAKLAGPAIAQTARFGAEVPNVGGGLYNKAGSVVEILSRMATGGMPRPEGNPISDALYKMGAKGKQLSEDMAAPAKEFAETKAEKFLQDAGAGAVGMGYELPFMSAAGLPLYSGLSSYGDARSSGAEEGDASIAGLYGAAQGGLLHGIFKGAGELPGKWTPKVTTATAMGGIAAVEGKPVEEVAREAVQAWAMTGKGREVAKPRAATTISQSPTPKDTQGAKPKVEDRASTGKGKALSLEELDRPYEVRSDKNGNPLEMASPEGERGIAAVDYTKGERAFIFDPQTKKWYDKTTGSRTEVTNPEQIKKLNDSKPGRGYVEQPPVEISENALPTAEERAALGVKEVPTAKGATPATVITQTPMGKEAPKPEEKISQVVTNTYAKELGGKTAEELSKDFMGYDPSVRKEQAARAANELLTDGLTNSANKLLSKETWDDYDVMKSNAIRNQMERNAKTPDDLRNPLFHEMLKRHKVEQSMTGKKLEASKHIDVAQEPIRAAERATEEIINSTPRLKGKKVEAERKTRNIKEKINEINKQTIKKNLDEITINVNRLLKREMKVDDIKLKDIIRKHYTEIDQTGKTLAEKISEGLGLSESEARVADQYIRNGFDILTRGAKNKVLEQMLGKNKVKKGEKDLTQKIVELSNLGALSEAQFADIVAKRIGVPVITAEHMFELNKQAERVQLAKGEAKIDEIGRLYAMLYPDVPKTRMQKLWDIRVLSMLANAKTVERNMLGQGFDTLATSLAKDTIGVTVDKWIANKLSKKIGEPVNRTMVKTDWSYLIKQGIKSGKMGMADVRKRIDTTKARIEYLTGTKLGKEADKFGLGKDEWKPGGIMDKVQKGVAIGLQVPDRAFQEAVYWESYLNQIKALGPNAKASLTPEMKQKISTQAWSEGSQITYRQMNKFSTAIVDLQKKMGPLGKLLLTFPKVAANIVYTGAYKYSPVGLGVSLNKARKFINSGGEALDRGGNPMSQRQISFDIARGGAGTSVTALGMLLGYLGTASAARDSDSNVQLTKESKGEQPGSIKLFGHSVRVDWIQPLSIPLELGVQIGAALKNKKSGADMLEEATDILMGATTAIVDQPLFTGIQRAASSSGKTPGEKVWNAAKSVATSAAASWIPTLSGQARQAIDPYQRQLNRKFGEGVGNSLKAFGFASAALVANKIPFLSTLLEKRKNIFGEDIKYHQYEILPTGNLLLDVLDRFVNPAIISDLRNEPGIDYVLQLNRDKPDDMSEKPLPRQTERTQFIKADGKKYFFTPKQKSKYQEIVGKEVYDYINNYYESGMGSGLSPEEQVREIYKEISRIGANKRQEMLDEIMPAI
jgi:hypothetical protein